MQARRTGQSLAEFLFTLPEKPISRDERIRLLKEAIKNEDEPSQEQLDRFLARLLEAIQKDE